jgi:iron transport multicopper oxidase
LTKKKAAALALMAYCVVSIPYFAYSSAAANRISSPSVQTTQSAHTSAPTADEGTNRGGLSQDGWYPEASLLTPTNVSSDRFGLLFSVPVTGQVYAQPVMDGSNAIVATEENWVYAINQVTGVRQWAVQVGADVGAQPFNSVSPTAASLSPWECADLEPYIGITSTPVVDPTTGIIYVVAMEQLANGTLGYFMHALNPANGEDEPNFPVEIEGAAQNNPSTVFVANDELERVALTLTDGVVYFGFSSHCDTVPYQGYVAGVSESGRLTALWTDVFDDSSALAGIWQAGGGFASDSPGQLIGASGNANPGASPSGTISGKSPPATGALGESVFRLVAQKDGSLEVTDFFTPYDAATLDTDDLDFGSGAPVLLPSQFGTAAYPHLIVQTGKEGYVYLLDAQNLGGVSPGDAGALAEQGPDGGAWATPGVWPGNGGYIYIPTSDGGTMSLGNSTQGDFNVFHVTKPSGTSSTFDLELVAKGPQPVGFGTSSPIVTSNSITAGSAVVWIIQLQNGGVGEAELQAYDALPSAGTSTNPGILRLINQWPIGNGMKFTPPGVGDNRLFVPTMDNRLMVFGLHAPAIATGRGVTFGSTTVGKASTATIPIVAKRAFTITSGASACGVCTRTSQFKVVGTEPAITHGEVSVRAGQTLLVTATFRPTGSPGLRSDVLRLVTSHGEVDFTLSGVGRASTPWVTPSTLGLTLPDFIIGQARPVVSTMTFTNFGSVAAKITKYSSNLAPFTVSGVPKVGTSIAPGESFRVKISFRSQTQSTFHRVLIVKTNSPASVANSAIDLNSVASAGP